MADIPVHNPRGQFTDHMSMSENGQNSSIINDHSEPLAENRRFISSDISSASNVYARNTQTFSQETQGVVHSSMVFSTSIPIPMINQGDSALPCPPLMSSPKQYVAYAPHAPAPISGAKRSNQMSRDNSSAVARPQIPEAASIPSSIMPVDWRQERKNGAQTHPQNNFACNAVYPSSFMASYPDKSTEAPQTANGQLPQRMVAVPLPPKLPSVAPTPKEHGDTSLYSQSAAEATKLHTKDAAVPFSLPQSASAADARYLQLSDHNGWGNGRDSGGSKGTTDSLKAEPQVRVLSQHRAMARARTRSGDGESGGVQQHRLSRGCSSPSTGHAHSRSLGQSSSRTASKSCGRGSSRADDSVGSLTVLALMRHSSHDPREPSASATEAAAATRTAASSSVSDVYDMSPSKQRARSTVPATAARAPTSMPVNRLSSTPFSPQHLHTAVASATTSTAENAQSTFLSPTHVAAVPLHMPVDEQSPSDTDSSPIEPLVETFPCRAPAVLTFACLPKTSHAPQSQGAPKASVDEANNEANTGSVPAGRRTDKQVNNQGITPARSLVMPVKPTSVKAVSVPSPVVTTSSTVHTPAAAAIANTSVHVAPASAPHTRHTYNAPASPAASRLPSCHPPALPLLAVTLPPSNPGSPASIVSPLSAVSPFRGPSPRTAAGLVQRPQSMPPRASITRLSAHVPPEGPSYVPRVAQRGLVLGSFARKPSPLPLTPVPLAEARPVLQPPQTSGANAHSRTLPRTVPVGDVSNTIAAVGPLPPVTVSVRPRGRHSRPGHNIVDVARGDGEVYENEGGKGACGAHGGVVWGAGRDDWSDSTVSPLAVANLERSGRYDSTPTHSSRSSPSRRSPVQSASWRTTSAEEAGQRLRVVIPPLALPPAQAEVWDGRSYTVKASPKGADGTSQARYLTRHLVGFGEDEDSWYSGMTDEYGDSEQDRMYYAGSDAAMCDEDSTPDRRQGRHAREWFNYGEGYGIAPMKDAEGYSYNGAPFRSSRYDDEYDDGYEYRYDDGYNDGYGDKYGRGHWVDVRAAQNGSSANKADAICHRHHSFSHSSASRSHSRPAPQPPYASSVSTSASVDGRLQRTMNTDGSAWETSQHPDQVQQPYTLLDDVPAPIATSQHLHAYQPEQRTQALEPTAVVPPQPRVRALAPQQVMYDPPQSVYASSQHAYAPVSIALSYVQDAYGQTHQVYVPIPHPPTHAHAHPHAHSPVHPAYVYAQPYAQAHYHHQQLQHQLQPHPPQQQLVHMLSSGQEAHVHAPLMHTYAHTRAPVLTPHAQMPQALAHPNMQAPVPYVSATMNEDSQAQRWLMSQHAMGMPSGAPHQPVIAAAPTGVVGVYEAHVRHAELVRDQHPHSQAHSHPYARPNAQEVMRTQVLPLAQAHLPAQSSQPHDGQLLPRQTAPPPAQHASVAMQPAQHAMPQAQYVQQHLLQHPSGLLQHAPAVPLPPHLPAHQHAPLPHSHGLMPPRVTLAPQMPQPASVVQHAQALPPPSTKPPSLPTLSTGLSSPLVPTLPPQQSVHARSEPPHPSSQPPALLPSSTYQYAPPSHPKPPDAAQVRSEAIVVPMPPSHQQITPASATPFSLRTPLPLRTPSAPPCIPLPKLPQPSASGPFSPHTHQPPAQPQRHGAAADASVLPSPALVHARTTPLPSPMDSSASFAPGLLHSKTSGTGHSALNISLHSHRSTASHAQSQSRGRTSVRPGSQRPTPTSSPAHASTPAPIPRALSLLTTSCTPPQATAQVGGSDYATPAQPLRRSLQSLDEGVAVAAMATIGPGPYMKALTPPLPSPLVQSPSHNESCAPLTQMTPTRATFGGPVPPLTSATQDAHVLAPISANLSPTPPAALVALAGVTIAYAYPHQPRPPRQPCLGSVSTTPAPRPIVTAASAARALPQAYMRPAAPDRAHSEHGLERPTAPLPTPPTRRPTRTLTPAMLVCPFPWERIHGRQKRRYASLPPTAKCTVSSTAVAPPRMLATASATPSVATVTSTVPPSCAPTMASRVPTVLTTADASATATNPNTSAMPAAAPTAAATLPRTPLSTDHRSTSPCAILPGAPGAIGTASIASAPILPSTDTTPAPAPMHASTTNTQTPAPTTHTSVPTCTAPAPAVVSTKVSPGSTLRAYPLIRQRSRSRVTPTPSRSPLTSSSPRAHSPAVRDALEVTTQKVASTACTAPAPKPVASTPSSSIATPTSTRQLVRTPALVSAASGVQASVSTPKTADRTPAPGQDESPPMHEDGYSTPARREVGNDRSVSRSSNPHKGSLWQLRMEKGKDASATRQSNVGGDATSNAREDSAGRVLEPLPEDPPSLGTTPSPARKNLPSPKGPLIQLRLHVPDAPAPAVSEGKVDARSLVPPTALCLSSSSSSDTPCENVSAVVSTSPASIAARPCPVSPAHPRPQNMYTRAFSPSRTGSQSGKSTTPSPAVTQPSTPSAKYSQQLLRVPSLPLSQTPSLARTPALSQSTTPSRLTLSADAPLQPFASSPTAGRLPSLSSSATSTPSGPLPLRRIPSPPATAPTAPMLIRRASFATVPAQSSSTGFVPPSQYPFHPPFLPPRSVVLEPYGGNTATPANAPIPPSTHTPTPPRDTPSAPESASTTPAISRAAPILGTAPAARTTPKASDKALAAIQAILHAPPATEAVLSKDVPERPRGPSPSRRNAYPTPPHPGTDQRAARAAYSASGPRPSQAIFPTTSSRRAPSQHLPSAQRISALTEDTQSTRSSKASGLSAPDAPPLARASASPAPAAHSQEKALPQSTRAPVDSLALAHPSSLPPPRADPPLPSAVAQPHALYLQTDLSPAAADALSASLTPHTGDTPQSVDTTHSQDMHQLAQQLGVSPIRHPSVPPWRKEPTAAAVASHPQHTLPPADDTVAAPREHSSVQSEATAHSRPLPPIDAAPLAGSRSLSHVVQVLSPVARPPTASSYNRPLSRANFSSPYPSSPQSAHAHGSHGRRPSSNGSHTTPAPAQSTPSRKRLHSLATAGPSPLRLPTTPLLPPSPIPPTSTPHPTLPRPTSSNPSFSSLPRSADHPSGALSAEAHIHAGLELARRAQSHAGDRALSSCSYSSLFTPADLSFRPALPNLPEQLAFPAHPHHAAASQGLSARRRPVLERHASEEAAYTPSLPASATHSRAHHRRTSLSQPRPTPLALPTPATLVPSPRAPLLALPPHPPMPTLSQGSSRAAPTPPTSTCTATAPAHGTLAPSGVSPAACAPIAPTKASVPAATSFAAQFVVPVRSASTASLPTPPRPDASAHNRPPARATTASAASFASTAACTTASTLPSTLSSAALSMSATRVSTTVASFAASSSGPLSVFASSAQASLNSYPSLSPTPSFISSPMEKAPAVSRLNHPKPTTAYRSTPPHPTNPAHPRPPGPYPSGHPSTPLQTRASAPTALPPSLQMP